MQFNKSKSFYFKVSTLFSIWGVNLVNVLFYILYRFSNLLLLFNKIEFTISKLVISESKYPSIKFTKQVVSINFKKKFWVVSGHSSFITSFNCFLFKNSDPKGFSISIFMNSKDFCKRN